jgi:hypothetical protein
MGKRSSAAKINLIYANYKTEYTNLGAVVAVVLGDSAASCGRMGLLESCGWSIERARVCAVVSGDSYIALFDRLARIYAGMPVVWESEYNADYPTLKKTRRALRVMLRRHVKRINQLMAESGFPAFVITD